MRYFSSSVLLLIGLAGPLVAVAAEAVTPAQGGPAVSGDPGCGKNYCCLLEKAKSIPMAHPLIPSPSPPMFPPSTVTANPCAISL